MPRQLTLFDHGFRPFFLGATLFAGVALPLWIAAFRDGVEWPSHLTARDWHVHEMIFGYFGAVLAGFVLTAVPNWTQRLPVRGGPLAALAGLWLAGRIAMAVSDGWALPAAALEASYLVALAFVVARELVAGRGAKNLPVGTLIALVALANIGFHAAVLTDAETAPFVRAALAVAAMLISLIGGRIVPSFTRNWLAKQEGSALPAAFSAFDKLTLAVTAATLLAWIAVPRWDGTGVLFATAAILQAARILRWRFWGTWREPLVTILHVGALWIAVWCALEAASILADSPIDASAATHALTAGAIGTMTLAVMTRATLGHTGRALVAGPGTVAIYLLVNLGALLRVLASVLPWAPVTVLAVSGWIWAAAFLLFVVLYGPMLAGPRADAARHSRP